MELRSKLDGLEIETLDVLDLGCGHNASPVSSQVLTLPFKSLTSVDIYAPYLDLLSKKSAAALHHWIRECNILDFASKVMPGSFDVSLLLDVLEHFPVLEAERLLYDIEMNTRSRIILWLPIGNCPQHEMDGNPYQVHKSTWEVEHLETLGFEVEHLVAFHQHFHPPVDAAWAVKDLE